MHENKVEFEVYGDNALFSDPLTRPGGEKCSYPVPTYEAIKGILHSIYWKPTLIWIVDKVRVMSPISMESKGVMTLKPNGKDRDLSYYTYLKKCRYQVMAHFVWNENRPEYEEDRNENKHFDIARRSIAAGGRRDVFLGCRECQAYVEPCEFGFGSGAYDDNALVSFGLMYHGITYADESYDEATKDKMTVRFWNAEMRNGVITYPKPWECPVTRPIRGMKIKHFRLSADASGKEEAK